jgi:hypothetical protein
MLCPECNRSFEGAAGSCPRCGNVKGVIKTSTILIARGEQRSVYRSVEDVPDALKRQLLRSTNGLNSATIVIADRQGRKEIAKAIRNLPASSSPAASQPVKASSAFCCQGLLQAIGVFGLLGAAALVWFIFR